MIQPPASEGSLSLNLIEIGLTAIAVAASFAWPRLANRQFSALERSFGALARKKGLAVAVCGISVVLLRLAILPICPIPLPFVPDDFSFLLASDTFLHGRLANPTPAMWVHFETIHVDMRPTYMSMYFPAEGLILAAGKVLLGHPWFGILCVDGLLCAALCWMLQAWVPPAWALLGTIIAIVRLGLFSYWINTYAGGSGLLVALGGALVLGAYPRIIGRVRLWEGLLLAFGIVILALGRPYEGLLLCLPVALGLGRWMIRGKNRPPLGALIGRAILPLLIVAAAMAWLGYYDYRAFGNPLTLPYTINRNTYAMAPYFIWQHPRPQPVYHHKMLLTFYRDKELAAYYLIGGWKGYAQQNFIKALRATLFFAGVVFMPPLLMSRRVLLDRRVRFVVVCLCFLIAGMAIEVFMIPHYLGAFTVVFYALGIQATRHLWVWRPGDAPAGKAMVRFLVATCVLLAGLRLSVPAHDLAIPMWPASEWSGFWFGPLHFGVERAGIQKKLEQTPGTHLILVRYAPTHDSINEWVYNGADIDGSKVVWAREMEGTDNQELLRYYPDRKVWLVEPDASPPRLSPYPMPESASRGQGEPAAGQSSRTPLKPGDKSHD